MGWILIICGIIFLMFAVGGALMPLATLRIGPVEVTGLSQFSALNAFIGIVLIAMGIFVNSGKRVF
jgi:hypothetical protein